jgi:hypothetical protein
MKRKTYLLFCLIFLIGITACGNGVPANSAPTESASSDESLHDAAPTDNASSDVSTGNTSLESESTNEIDWSENTTYTWWINAQANDWYTSYNDNAVVKYLENRFNINFEFEEPVSGTESDSLSLMMGTGQYTDILDLSSYTGSVSELLEDGIIVDFAKYLNYMPNFKNLIETIPEFAQATYTDDGHIISLPGYNDDDVPPWSGLIYRRDILDAITGGNIQFPSGTEDPTTLEDWEYMLPLYKSYFEAAGMAEYAPLIIPSSGYFHFGELMSTFGAYYTFYERNDEIHAGILERPMYDYVSKMREWYSKGYIYQDFASRTQDMFFMPNTALTYGGAAGIWYGMSMNLGDKMSMPEYGLIFDAQGIASPRAEGITYKDMISRSEAKYGGAGIGTSVSTSCENLEKLLSVFDLFYTDEGGLLRTYGLTKDEIPPGYTIYEKMGLSDGTYWFDAENNLVINPNIDDVGGPIGRDKVNGIRFPGYQMISYVNHLRDDLTKKAHDAWGAHNNETEVHALPNKLSYTTDESVTISDNNSHITDLVNEMIPKFIMGVEELNENTWAAFTEKLVGYGIEINKNIHQASYDRYLKRAQ